uniref:CSON007803 protein n=1 Tax=Culicoides sonorensis TaxID=179676 RepID=A0A336MUP0_CULSO
MSSELVLILKTLISVIERQPYQNWNSIFISSKLYDHVLSCLNAICQNYEKSKITEGLLELSCIIHQVTPKSSNAKLVANLYQRHSISYLMT